VLGDSDGVRLEHAVEMFGTTHFIPPGSGVLDRVEWLLAMIPPFLDPPPAAG
jgi:hypothetical protein